jgi:hypothetical protein
MIGWRVRAPISAAGGMLAGWLSRRSASGITGGSRPSEQYQVELPVRIPLSQ